MTERLLVLVRHGQSEWNLKNLFTGWRDVNLTTQGIAEARTAGKKLKAQGIRFDVAFTSALVRAQRTLDLVLEEMGQTNIPVLKDQALNERDYGDLVGLNKDDARKQWGEEQVQKWRRSYDIAPPGGESLKDTVAPALPYFVQEILPRVLRGERTLVSAHGNPPRPPAEHGTLAREAPMITGEVAAFADHPMTGHDEGDRILPDRSPHRARGLGPAELGRNVRIGGRPP